MIRKDHIVFFLRTRTIRFAATASLCLATVIPLLSLICIILGGIPWLLLAILYVICAVLLVAGGLCTLAILSGEGAPIGFAGLIVAILSYQFMEKGGPSLQVWATDIWQTCRDYAWWLINDIYFGHLLWLWTWAPLVATLSAAAIILGTVAFLRIFPQILRFWRDIRLVCVSCGERATPQHRCPKCRTIVSDLAASKYGVFSASCESCGERMPTSDLLGRSHLDKVCAKCGADQFHPDWGRLPDYAFAFTGSPRSGKSNLMIALLRTIEEWGNKWGLRLDDGPDAAGHAYRAGLQEHLRGVPVSKTPESPRPQALQCSLTDSRSQGVLLRFDDAAGESFQDPEAMRGLASQRHADVFVLAIEPGGVGSESLVPNLLQSIEWFQNVSTKERITAPLAVVLTKYDLVTERGSAEKGTTGATGVKANIDSATTEDAQEVRELISRRWPDTVSLLETHFIHVGYFACSALGREPAPGESHRFEPIGCDPLATWLLHAAGVSEKLRSLPVGRGRFLAQNRQFGRTHPRHRWRRRIRGLVLTGAGLLLVFIARPFGSLSENEIRKMPKVEAVEGQLLDIPLSLNDTGTVLHTSFDDLRIVAPLLMTPGSATTAPVEPACEDGTVIAFANINATEPTPLALTDAVSALAIGPALGAPATEERRYSGTDVVIQKNDPAENVSPSPKSTASTDSDKPQSARDEVPAPPVRIKSSLLADEADQGHDSPVQATKPQPDRTQFIGKIVGKWEIDEKGFRKALRATWIATQGLSETRMSSTYSHALDKSVKDAVKHHFPTLEVFIWPDHTFKLTVKGQSGTPCSHLGKWWDEGGTVGFSQFKQHPFKTAFVDDHVVIIVPFDDFQRVHVSATMKRTKKNL